jgi:divalent metal cation (Fe/Co/Zn/Cd) transporter
MSTAHRTTLTAAQRARLGRRAQVLAAASVTYNVVEAGIAIAAGLTAGSVALIGFGLDSVVEVSSGLIILWQFRHRVPESRERTALRLIGLSFLALAAYVTYESVSALITGADADHSPVGIGLAAASLLVMPVLSRAQRRTGRALQSSTVVADGTQTLLCAWLSAALLAGLLLNAALGWSWADPTAALVIAAVATREGVLAWRGENCCATTGTPHHHDHTFTGTDGIPGEAGCPDGCCAPGNTLRNDAAIKDLRVRR